MIYLISIFFFSLPAKTLDQNCDYTENLGQQGLNRCAFNDYLVSEKSLSDVLSTETLEEWKIISNRVCKEVWKLYKKGSIYSLQVSKCKTRMNNFLYLSKQTGMKGGMNDYEKLLK